MSKLSTFSSFDSRMIFDLLGLSDESAGYRIDFDELEAGLLLLQGVIGLILIVIIVYQV
jgi:hypothetical protein